MTQTRVPAVAVVVGTYGFLGLAQIDPYGNINTSILGPRDQPKVRLPGSGGANDIASLCRDLLIVSVHEFLALLPGLVDEDLDSP